MQLRRVLSGVAAVAFAGASSAAARDLPQMGHAPVLSIRDAVTGAALHAELAHKVVVVAFVESTCASSCPRTEATFVRVARDLTRARVLGHDVELVLVGIDTRRNATSLRRPAFGLGAVKSGFHVGRATGADLARIERGFGLAASGSHGDEHTVDAFLIDRRGDVRFSFGPLYPASSIERFAVDLARHGNARAKK